MRVRVLSWNLFHGRDSPPDPSLFTWRSRLLRITERGSSHAQVNRDLFDSFAAVLCSADWDVALLQECPPRWAERLATECGAEPHLVPTSRNLPAVGRLQAAAADFNPDLIASWEGGSNLTLVRTARIDRATIVERRMLPLATRPERRTMAFSRLDYGLCIANLHASAGREQAEQELPRAATTAHAWARGAPLLLGGDFNLRPALSAPVFARLFHDYGLAAPTGERVIDHLLTTGVEVVEPPRAWAEEEREVADPTGPRTEALPIRLSDHAPIVALIEVPARAQGPAH